jgi:photosystem II stability/assembly factor-like uncharacterized protein
VCLFEFNYNSNNFFLPQVYLLQTQIFTLMNRLLLNLKYIIIVFILLISENLIHAQCTENVTQVLSDDISSQIYFSSVSIGYYIYRKNPCTGPYANQCAPQIHILKTLDSGKTWNQIYSNPRPKKLFFLNDTLGYSFSLGGAEKTINGGISWTTLKVASISGVFTDVNHGYIASWPGIFATKDGGQTWDTVYRTSVSAICFANPDTGFAIGAAGLLVKSTDAGKTWQPVNLNVSGNLNAICFADKNNGYIAGTKGVILKTTNSGKIWTTIQLPDTTSFGAIAFYDALNGIVINTYEASPTVFKTEDGGKTWKSFSMPASYGFYPSLAYKQPSVAFSTNISLYKISCEQSVTSIVGANAPSKDGVVVYPNPSNGNFTIATSQSDNSNVSIFNSTGTVIKHAGLTGTSTNIHLGNVPQGIYYMQVSSPNGGNITSKLIIE